MTVPAATKARANAPSASARRHRAVLASPSQASGAQGSVAGGSDCGTLSTGRAGALIDSPPSTLLGGSLSTLAAGRLVLRGRSTLAAVASGPGLLAAVARRLRRVGDLCRALLGHPVVLQRF